MEPEIQDALTTYDELKKHCYGYNGGHTYLLEKDLKLKLSASCGKTDIGEKDWERVSEILEENQAVLCEKVQTAGRCGEVQTTTRVFLYNQWEKEINAANCFQRLFKIGATEIDGGVAPGFMDKDQQNAVNRIIDEPLTIICGKGGSGKTTVVLATLQMLPPEMVALTAPTGKAASNLTKKSSGAHEASTLHQLTASFFQWRRQKKAWTEKIQNGKIKDNVKVPTWRYSQTEVWVVDECSLVPVSIFADAFHLLLEYSEAGLKRVVLLGDHHQLPSIEPGNLLGDLVKHFSTTKNFVELKKCYRTESQLIIDNAKLIQDGREPNFNKKGFEILQWTINNDTDGKFD